MRHRPHFWRGKPIQKKGALRGGNPKKKRAGAAGCQELSCSDQEVLQRALERHKLVEERWWVLLPRCLNPATLSLVGVVLAALLVTWRYS